MTGMLASNRDLLPLRKSGSRENWTNGPKMSPLGRNKGVKHRDYRYIKQQLLGHGTQRHRTRKVIMLGSQYIF